MVHLSSVRYKPTSKNQKYFDVAGDNDDKGNEEDDAVERRVVEIFPVARSESKEHQHRLVSNNNFFREILKEVYCCALIELLHWMLENSATEYCCGRI